MLQPHGRQVLISRIPEPRPQSALLIVPDTISDRPSPFGFVLGVGSKVREPLQVGDHVVLADYSGFPTTVDIEGTEVEAFVMHEDYVLMVIEGASL